MKKKLALGAAVLLAVVTIGGCGSTENQYGTYVYEGTNNTIIYAEEEGSSALCLCYPDTNMELDIYGTFTFEEDGSGKLTFESYKAGVIDDSVEPEDQSVEDAYVESLTNIGESFLSIGYMFTSYQETDTQYVITIFDSGNDVLGIFTKNKSEE